jgi:putative iron-regulated protein
MISACSDSEQAGITLPSAEQKIEAIENYANIAEAMFDDANADAVELKTAVDLFASTPTGTSLDAAKDAYVTARQSYQQTEFLRFDEGFVNSSPESDGGLESVDSWEGQVNAWPLDEALIDYVSSAYSGGSPNNSASIVGNTSITVNGETVDTSTIDKELLISLNEIGGSEANVATGFHAVEFLLWGQDSSQALSTAGQRAATDYNTTSACTNGNCGRRGDYIKAAADLIVDDITAMAAEWDSPAATTQTTKTLRSDLLALDSNVALQRILFGLGSLSLGETASERMRVARIANSPEDEHDCFSDTSHNSYFYNVKGIASAYRGEYASDSNGTITGTSLSDLVAVASASANEEVEQAIDNVLSAFTTLNSAGEIGQTFDYLIASVNGTSNDTNGIVLAAEQSLIDFTELLEAGAAKINVSVSSDGGSQF